MALYFKNLSREHDATNSRGSRGSLSFQSSLIPNPPTNTIRQDIPLHDREPARTSLNSNGPPLTPSEQPPPDYNTHDVSCTPPPYIDKKPKWWANRRLYISLAITGSIVILVTVLAKTLKVQVEKVAEKEYTWDMDNISQAKVYGLAATECEQGTFVVWKVKSGHYFWKGTLLKGDWNENSGEIPVMKVDQGDKIDYRREGFVNMTATCWESRFGLVVSSLSSFFPPQTLLS